MKSIIEQSLLWLSGSDANLLLNECPRWEKIKYEAFGASVLVPVAFGAIASSYAVSTLTDNWFIIVGFALVWGMIILAIDRLLLSTYRAYASKGRKALQFILRITVAVLMGLTVSHPLTLLLFKDTINSEIEKHRNEEMISIREESLFQKDIIESRIEQKSVQLAQQQKRYEDTLSGKFLNGADSPAKASALSTNTEFRDLDTQIAALKSERNTVRVDLEKWQYTYDEEVRGVRSGNPGIGPNAIAIERDHITWRKAEVTRMSQEINLLADKRLELSSEYYNNQARTEAAIASTRRDLEKQKLDMFASQQGDLLAVIRGQIDSASAELDRLRQEASQLGQNTSERIDEVKNEKRSDLMKQTLVLHEIFESPDSGGKFALMVYVVIAGLFTLIDTIPLVVKFFSVPGPYDTFVELQDKCHSHLRTNDINFKVTESMIKRHQISDLVGMQTGARQALPLPKSSQLPPPPPVETIAQNPEPTHQQKVVYQNLPNPDIAIQPPIAPESANIEFTTGPASPTNASHVSATPIVDKVEPKTFHTSANTNQDPEPRGLRRTTDSTKPATADSSIDHFFSQHEASFLSEPTEGSPAFMAQESDVIVKMPNSFAENETYSATQPNAFDNDTDELAEGFGELVFGNGEPTEQSEPRAKSGGKKPFRSLTTVRSVS